MEESRQEQADELQWAGRATPMQAFESATLDLAMEGIRIDPYEVPALVGYMQGTMTYAEARETLLRSYSRN